MKPQICQWCRWWAVEWGRREDPQSAGGTCRYNPPYTVMNKNSVPIGAFPSARPDGFCSKWEEWQDPKKIEALKEMAENAQYLKVLNGD